LFSSRRRHTRSDRDWSSDVCSSDLGQVENLPWVDLAVPDKLDQVRQEPAHRSRTSMYVNVGEEQLYARDLDLVVDPDKAHVPTRSEERRVGKEGRTKGTTSL